MKILLMLLIVLLVVDECVAEQHLYLAAGGKLTVYAIAESSGRLEQTQSVNLRGAGPFRFSADGRRVYVAAGSREEPALATFDRLDGGSLVLVHQASVDIKPGYLDVDRTGRYLAGNHYGEGKVTIWKLENGVYRGLAVQELELEPKAHGTNFSADNHWLLVPATGPNKVFVNRFDEETGRLTPHDPAFAMGPTGQGEARQPRHLLLHPTTPDLLYTTNENSQPGVCVWRWSTESGTLRPIQNLITRPAGIAGKLSTSTLRMTPDAKFLYVANRSREGHSSIVGFRVSAESGQLTLIDHTRCESVPRTFCLDRLGKYLFVAGQHDHRLGSYAIDQQRGTLEKIDQYVVGKAPSWMETR